MFPLLLFIKAYIGRKKFRNLLTCIITIAFSFKNVKNSIKFNISQDDPWVKSKIKNQI